MQNVTINAARNLQEKSKSHQQQEIQRKSISKQKTTRKSKKKCSKRKEKQTTNENLRKSMDEVEEQK